MTRILNVANCGKINCIAHEWTAVVLTPAPVISLLASPSPVHVIHRPPVRMYVYTQRSPPLGEGEQAEGWS